MKKHDQKEYKCPLCDHVMDMDYYLKDHVNRVQSPIHVCKYTPNGCTYTSKLRSTMTEHEIWCEYKLSSSEEEDPNEDEEEEEKEEN